MRKKHTKKKVRVASKRNSSATRPVLFSRRILFITSSLGVLLLVILIGNKREVLHSVQGASVTRGLFEEAIIPMPHITGAVGYNIYYTGHTDTVFTDAVRGVSTDYLTYTIGYLLKGVTYKYQVSAYDASGKEFWFSPVTNMTNLQSM